MKEIWITFIFVIVGLLLLFDLRLANKGKGIVVKYFVELEISDRIVDLLEKVAKKSQKKIEKLQKLLKKIDRNRKKIYTMMWIGVLVFLFVAAYGKHTLLEQTIILESRQYYFWWYENRYEQNWYYL